MRVKFFRASQGTDLAEYALILAALCLGLLFPISELARAIRGLYSTTTPAVQNLRPGAPPQNPLVPPPAGLQRERRPAPSQPAAKGAPLGGLVSWLASLFLLALGLGSLLVRLIERAVSSEVGSADWHGPPLRLAIESEEAADSPRRAVGRPPGR